LQIDPAWVAEVRSQLPELAPERCARFEEDYGLPEYDARLLTATKAAADFYERTLALGRTSGLGHDSLAKQVSNWMLGDLARLLNLQNREIGESPVSPEHLVELIGMVDSGTVSVTLAKTVLEEAFETGGSPARIVEAKGYTQISDTSAVDAAVRQALDENPQAVADYVGGKDTAAKFLVGQVMKLTKGQAKPDLVNQLVNETLEALKTD
jgi:aspartyl-tRNA(Asn)/glutamyl-tRNA(Gln) amidotransferase subunit B